MTFYSFLKYLLYIIVLSIFVSCSSNSNGSSDNDSSSNDKVHVVIDEASAEQVVIDMFDSIDNANPKFPTGATARVAKVFSNLSFMNKPLFRTVALYSNIDDTIGDSGIDTCIDGGSISYNGSGVVYIDCVESGVKVNGSIGVTYNNSSGEAIYKLTNFSVEENSTKYFTSSTTYTISNTDITYQTTGYIISGNARVDFENYNYNLTSTDTTYLISIDGYIKTDCFDKWVEVQTVKPMSIDSSACPNDGEIIIVGDSSKLKLKFNIDESVNIYLNDALYKEYSNCNTLPTSTGSCSI